MNKITSFKQIKEIIEPIPSNKFVSGHLGYSSGKSCYLGHINRAMNKSSKYLFGIISRNNPNDFISGGYNAFGANELTVNMIKEVHGITCKGYSVNDFPDINGYNEPEIKDRLMHMIEDGIKWENSKKV